MAVRLRCPYCKSMNTVADSRAGKMVRCEECDESIQVPDGEVMERRPGSAPRASADRRFRDDEDDDRPRRRRSREDSDELPRRRNRREAPSGLNGGIIALICVAAAVLLIVVVGGAAWFFMSEEAPVAQRRAIAPPRPVPVDLPKQFADQPVVVPPPVPIARDVEPNKPAATDKILDKSDTLQITDPPNKRRPGTRQKSYSVVLLKDKTYVIDLKQAPGSFWDPYLILLEGTRVVAEDDDSGGGFDARIVYTAAKTGLHRVIVTSFVANEFGEFRLTVREAGAGENVAVKPPFNPPINPMPPVFVPPPVNNPPVVANPGKLNVVEGPSIRPGGRQTHVHRLAFAPDGNTLFAACDGGEIYSYLLPQAQPLSGLSISKKASITFMAMTPDGRYMVCSSIVKAVTVFDVAAKKELAVFPLTSNWPNAAVAIAPDGKNIFTAYFGAPGVWDIKMINVANRDEKVLLKSPGVVDALAVSPDGKLLAASSARSDVVIYDLDKKQTLFTLKGHAKFIWSVAFSADSKLLASTSSDGSARVWNTATGIEVRALTGHLAPVSSASFSPDGKILVTGCGGVRSFDLGENSKLGEVRFWDLASGELLYQTQGPAGVTSVAFSPNGTRVAAGTRSEIRVFDVRKN